MAIKSLCCASRAASHASRAASSAASHDAAHTASRAAEISSFVAFPTACISETSSAFSEHSSEIKCWICRTHRTAKRRTSGASMLLSAHIASSSPFESRIDLKESGSSSALVFPRYVSSLPHPSQQGECSRILFSVV